MLVSMSCYAHQVTIVGSRQDTMQIVCIDGDKIKAHEQHVADAQKRYRYIKPALTICGASFIVGYFWYTSSSLSGEEIKEIRTLLAEKKNQQVTNNSWFEWSKSNACSIGGVAVELIGGALIIPPLSDLIGKLTGCKHVLSSLELYDKEYTHCSALIAQIARDMQMNLTSQAAGKPMVIGTHEVVNTFNRLVCRIEKLLGFMRVTLGKFSGKKLRQEAWAIEKRLVCYTNELCNDMRRLIDKSSIERSTVDKPALDSAAVLEIIVQFAQQYAQEMQRFGFLEQDARDIA